VIVIREPLERRIARPRGQLALESMRLDRRGAAAAERGHLWMTCDGPGQQER
jgi:hypothetical protein